MDNNAASSPKDTNAAKTENPMLGILLACIAFFLFSVMGAAAKWVSSEHSVFEIAFYRNAVTLGPFLLWIWWSKQGFQFFKVKKPWLMALRVLIGTTGLVITFKAVSLLPMAMATLIFLTASLWTPILAHIFLKEHTGWRRWSAIIIGMIGVFMILQPDGQVQTMGFILAALAALAHGSIHVVLRGLKDENPVTTTFYFIAGGAVLLLPFVAGHIHLPTTENALWLVFVGVAGGLAQLALSAALTHAQASLVSIFNYTGLIWASLLDIIIWQIVPGLNIFMGAAVIIAVKAYIIHRERQKSGKVDPNNTRAPFMRP